MNYENNLFSLLKLNHNMYILSYNDIKIDDDFASNKYKDQEGTMISFCKLTDSIRLEGNYIHYKIGKPEFNNYFNLKDSSIKVNFFYKSRAGFDNRSINTLINNYDIKSSSITIEYETDVFSNYMNEVRKFSEGCGIVSIPIAFFYTVSAYNESIEKFGKRYPNITALFLDLWTAEQNNITENSVRKLETVQFLNRAPKSAGFLKIGVA